MSDGRREVAGTTSATPLNHGYDGMSAAALEDWTEAVDPADLRSADTGALRHIAELAQQRDDVDAELTQTVQAARAAHQSWSEIGATLGVSKQAPNASTPPRPPPDCPNPLP